MLKKLIFILLVISSGIANAYTQCDYTPSKIWLENAGNGIWVCFDEGPCIKNYKSVIGEKGIDRTLSVAMAALSAGKKLSVRFNADNYACPSSGSFSDYSGFWLLK